MFFEKRLDVDLRSAIEHLKNRIRDIDQAKPDTHFRE